MTSVPHDRPRAALLMQPGLPDHLFDATMRGELDQLVELPASAILTDISADAARSAVVGAEILVTGWGCPQLPADLLHEARELRAIVHAGGQVTPLIDPQALATLRERGVQLANAGEANAVPVAEYCVAMILLANKGILRSERLYRERRAHLDREREFPSVGNYSKTVGIVTLSRISRIVIELLRPYALDVVVWSRSLTQEAAKELGVRKVDLDELMACSDIVSLHTPLLPGTEGMINARLLGLMKDGATLLNTARGGIVDAEALLGELEDGRIEAILDVTDPEPLPSDHRLWTLPNVVLTPHMAGSAGTELQRLGRTVLDEIARLRDGLPLWYAES